MCLRQQDQMFPQDPFVWFEASEKRFHDDFDLDFGVVLGARFAHMFSFHSPSGQNS